MRVVLISRPGTRRDGGGRSNDADKSKCSAAEKRRMLRRGDVMRVDGRNQPGTTICPCTLTIRNVGIDNLGVGKVVALIRCSSTLVPACRVLANVTKSLPNHFLSFISP